MLIYVPNNVIFFSAHILESFKDLEFIFFVLIALILLFHAYAIEMGH